MKRRREGTLGITRRELGDPPLPGFHGLSDFLAKAEALARSVLAEYPNGSLMAIRAEHLLVGVQRIRFDLPSQPAKILCYRGIVAALAYENILGEMRADRKRRGLTVRTYLQASEKLRLQSKTGKILQKNLAQECGMTRQRLLDWKKDNLE